MNLSGQCKSCQGKVEKLQLTDLEFSNLKGAFLKNVIVGKDIFIKSNPVEMAKFQDFISKLKPHDVVLDGLNIAYSNGVSTGPQVFSRNVGVNTLDFCSVLSLSVFLKDIGSCVAFCTAKQNCFGIRSVAYD